MLYISISSKDLYTCGSLLHFKVSHMSKSSPVIQPSSLSSTDPHYCFVTCSHMHCKEDEQVNSSKMGGWQFMLLGNLAFSLPDSYWVTKKDRSKLKR